GPLWMSRIVAGYCAHPLLVIDDLVHTALLVETRYSSENVSAGELLHRLLQARVLWRTISPNLAVCMPASCSCLYGLPASTASCCRVSPTKRTRSDEC